MAKTSPSELIKQMLKKATTLPAIPRKGIEEAIWFVKDGEQRVVDVSTSRLRSD